jgi:ABC-2 type transport system permease protein
MLDEILATFEKELKVIIREKRLLAIIILQPIILVSLFGYAFSGDLHDIPTVVVDNSQSVYSHRFITALNGETLRIKYFASTLSEAMELIKKGKASVVIYIPEGFDQALKAGKGKVIVVVDESNFNVAKTAKNYVEKVASRYSAEFFGGISIEQRYIFTTKTRLIDFVAPAIIGIVLQVLGLILSASSLTREKEEGTFELVLSMPIKSFSYIFGKFLCIITIVMFDALVVTFLTNQLFSVEIRGNIFLLFLAQLLFLSGSVGVGLAISTVSTTQIQAVQIAMMFSVICIFLSGIFYPLESMPEAARTIAYFVPLTYANIAFREIMVKGNGLDVVFPQIAFLTLYMVGSISFAVYLLKRRWL